MKAALNSRLPVLIRFADDAARADAWGRLERLAPSGARLSARLQLPRGERLWLDFDLPAQSLRAVAAQVTSVAVDEDGYQRLTLRFVEEEQRRGLGRLLRRLAGAPLPGR